MLFKRSKRNIENSFLCLTCTEPAQTLELPNAPELSSLIAHGWIRIMRFWHGALLYLASVGTFADSTFRDCEACPEMTVVPGGSYLKGSPQDEPGRSTDDRNHDEDDQVGPGGTQVEVTVSSFALGAYEVSNREFAEFIRKTGYEMRVGCVAYARRDGGWEQYPDASWDNTGRPIQKSGK